MHYSTSKDSDDGTVATKTVNTVHCLRLNCKRHKVSQAAYASVLRVKGETYCEGIVRNSRSLPWSKPTKVGSPVYSLHLKMEANKISGKLCCLRRWIKPKI